MSDTGPSDQQPENYRHYHQDVRLGSTHSKPWRRRFTRSSDVSPLIPEEEPTAKGEVLGDVAIRVIDGIAQRYASGEGYTPPAQVEVAPAPPIDIPPKGSIAAKALEAAGNFAERYVMARSQIHRAVRGKPSSKEAVEQDIAEILAERAKDPAAAMTWRMKLNELTENRDLASERANADPSAKNQDALVAAEIALLDFQFALDSPWADPRHSRHKEWVDWQNYLEAEAIGTSSPETIWQAAFDDLAATLAKAERDMEAYPCLSTEMAYDDAEAELRAFKFGDDSFWADPLHDRHDEWVEGNRRLKKDMADEAARAKIKPERTSISILADVGITTTSTKPAENFTDIWCIFCDRDQLDFIGTNRNESRVEIALTLHAAFATMIRMSGFDDEVLIASGIDLDDPCLETLATFLNERTNDRYSFGPYETSIDERLFNFLQ